MTGSVEPPTLLLCRSSSSSSPWSFLTRLSSPPSFSVRSDCPAFLTFQLRMLEIPSSCCGLAHSLLFHPSIPSHPSSCSSPSGLRWTRADVASLSGSPSPPSCISSSSSSSSPSLSFCLIWARESDRATWQPVWKALRQAFIHGAAV